MPQEVVFCAAAPSSSGIGSGAISLHDVETSVLLASFKQTNASTHCTAFMPSNHAQGGFILAAQSDKPILNVYNFQKVFVFWSIPWAASY
jgi:pre-rRNA-processing protein IPI3